MSYNKKPKTIDPNEVDPSVYYYDEVYDDMKKEEDDQNEIDKKRKESEKSKGSLYIKGLQETAEIRKTEKDLRRFKKYARDNEQTSTIPGEEVYVTAGYKRKLVEMKLLEEDKRRRLESEKGNTMNFIKKYKSDSNYTRSDNLKEIPPTDEPKPSSSNTALHDRTRERDSAQKNDAKEVIGPQAVRPKRELKTFREKKEYLRKVLAKRTVGKVLEDAIKRYKQRKAMEKG